MSKILSKIYTREYVQRILIRIVISLGLYGMVPNSSTIVLRNMLLEKVNEGMCVIENWLLIGFELWPLVGNPQL